MSTIELVLPADNEGESIGTTLRELHTVLNQERGLDVRFLVTEDGSRDNTVEVLRSLEADLPLTVITGPERKGYSRAVVDGFQATTADLVAFVDGDGQCDPNDLPRLLERLGDGDLVVGYRHPRKDVLVRRVMSGAFGFAYRRLFPIRLTDPSCPYLVVRRSALDRILRGSPGVLPQGFWWEFHARASAAGVVPVEVPVAHRVRTAGSTQVYRPTKVPGIAIEHLLGLLTLRRELASLAAPG